MKNVLSKIVAVSVLSLCGSVASAAVYPGNGGTSFGGVLSAGSLAIDNTPEGVVNFTFTPGASFSRNMVLYIDSTSGGISNNYLTAANAASDNTRAVTGVNGATRLTIAFPSTFAADYAVGFTVRTGNPPDGTLWTLTSSGGSDTLTSPKSIGLAGTQTTPSTFSFNLSDIGLTATEGASFKFVATYLNGSTGGFARANEFIGAVASSTPSSGNVNYTDVTLGDFRTYNVVVPEPTSLVAVAGIALLARKRMRRAAK